MNKLYFRRRLLALPAIFLLLKLIVGILRSLKALLVVTFTKSISSFLSQIVFIPSLIFRFTYLHFKIINIRKMWMSLAGKELIALASFENLTGNSGFAKLLLYRSREAEITSSPTSLRNYRIFSSKYFGAFGHTAFLDLWIKAVHLGILEKKPSIFTGLRDSYANRELLNYFESHLLSSVIEADKYSEEVLDKASEKLSYIQTARNELMWFDDFASEVQQAWEALYGDSPMIKMKSEHLQHSEHILRKKFGIGANDWFVAVHLRCSLDPMRNLRDVKVESYSPAIREIISKGGRVLRIGGLDYSPKISLKDENFFDLSRDVELDPVTNLYILAKCRFFLGVGSGPANVAGHVFGRPIAVTNIGPLGGRISWRNQVVLPKMFVNQSSKKVMTIEKRLSDEFGQIESRAALSKKGFDVKNNSSSEILDLATDMILATSGSFFNSKIFMKHHEKQKSFINKSTDNGRLYPVYCANSVLREYEEFY